MVICEIFRGQRPLAPEIWVSEKVDFEWVEQEAQLPQRNSTSAAHMEAAKPSSPHPLRPLATPMHTVKSETRKNVRQACRQ